MCNAKNCVTACARRIKYESALDRLEAKIKESERLIDFYGQVLKFSNARYPEKPELLVKKRDAAKKKFEQMWRVYAWVLNRLYFN